MHHHLAICSPGPLAAILDGSKTVESRLAVDRRPPWGRVKPGDWIWLKQSAGSVVGVARASWVRSFDGLTPARIEAILAANPGVRAESAYLAAKETARFATLIGLTSVAAIAPIVLAGRGRAGWRLLDAERAGYLQRSCIRLDRSE
ncbi:MAG: ASCH domain-containing protein [Dehalococcoidia bacterium]